MSASRRAIRVPDPRRTDPGFLAAIGVVLLFLVPSVLAIKGLRSVGMPAQLIGWVALLLWISGTFRGDGLAKGRQPVRVVMAVLLGGSLISYGIAFARPLELLESGNANRLAFLLLAGAGFALLIADGIASMRALRRLLTFAMIGAYFSATVALLQYFVSFNYNQLIAKTQVIVVNTTDYGVGQFNTNIGRGFRAYGTADHAIEFAVICSALLPLALHCRRFSAGRMQTMHTVGALILAAGALLSVSRSGVVGLVVGLVVYVLTLPRRDVLNFGAAALGLLVVIQVTAHGVLSTLRYLLFAGNADPSLQHRSDNIPYISPLVQEHLWTGIGFGTYQPDVYRVLDNQYLVTLVCSGVIGLAFLIFLYIFGATLARAGRRSHHEPREKDLGQALAAAILVLGVSAAFFDALAFRQCALLLFVLLGMTGAYWRLAQQDTSRVTNSRARGEDEREPQATT